MTTLVSPSPTVPSQIPYYATSLRERWQTRRKLWARARRIGTGELARVVLQEPVGWMGRSPDLDGLSLYRHALKRLVVPRQLYAGQGKTIMIVSHC